MRPYENSFELAAHRRLTPDDALTIVRVGVPADEIVRYAAEQRADLLVLGKHGHGMLRRFFLGSVADRVVRHADCPVMLTPLPVLRSQPIARDTGAAVLI